MHARTHAYYTDEYYDDLAFDNNTIIDARNSKILEFFFCYSYKSETRRLFYNVIEFPPIISIVRRPRRLKQGMIIYSKRPKIKENT